MKNLVQISEVLVLPNHQRVCVARFATRHFNLIGHADFALAEYDVEGPYETHSEAVRRARLLQSNEYELEQKRSAS